MKKIRTSMKIIMKKWNFSVNEKQTVKLSRSRSRKYSIGDKRQGKSWKKSKIKMKRVRVRGRKGKEK